MKHPHTISIPDDIWEYLSKSGNASETIRQLVEGEMNKPTVTIKSDYEGMFAGLSSDEMSKVDEMATVDAYETELRAALKKDFPEYNFELTYGPYGGKSIVVGPEIDPEGDISEYISETVSRVYERGQFWTMKK